MDPTRAPLGLEGKLYFKIGGIAAGGSFTEVATCQDLSMPSTMKEAPCTGRNSGGVEQVRAGLMVLAFQWKMPADNADAVYIALRAAYLARSIVGIRALDTETGEGPQADCQIMEFGAEQNLDNQDVVNVVAKPTNGPTGFSWYSPS